MTRIEPYIFMRYIASVLVPGITLPRGYYGRQDYLLLGYVLKEREAQLDAVERIYRFVLVMRSIPVATVAHMFDQCATTIYDDFHHVAIRCVDVFSTHFAPIIPNSREYYSMIGQKAFRHFPRALYAMDVTKVCFFFLYFFFIFFFFLFYFMFLFLLCDIMSIIIL